MWRKPIATESESKLHEKCANVQTYHLIWKMRSWIIAWSKFDNHFIKQSHIKFQPTNLIPRENHSQGVDANPNFVLRMRYFCLFHFLRVKYRWNPMYKKFELFTMSNRNLSSLLWYARSKHQEMLVVMCWRSTSEWLNEIVLKHYFRHVWMAKIGLTRNA